MSHSPITAALKALCDGEPLTPYESRQAIECVMRGEAPEGLLAAFLTALRFRGETSEVLTGAVMAVREHMLKLDVPADLRPIIDTCGTGGDGSSSLNVSTAVAIVLAATGLRVAKHGNRSASSSSGSAEVLTELGVAIELEPAALVGSLAEVGIAFLYAPRFHPALRYAGPVRKLLPYRTLFNLIGPLANPAAPDAQVLGVPRPEAVDLVGKALAELPNVPGFRAAVVCGGGSLDEVDPTRETQVAWLQPDAPRLSRRVWTPSDFGLDPFQPADLRVRCPAESAQRIREVLDGHPGPGRQIVLANAAAGLHIAGRAQTLAEGVRQAREAIDSGAARETLRKWAEFTQRTT